MSPSGNLTSAQLESYGLLTMPLAMAGLTLLTFLPTYYAVDLGLGLSVVGIVFAAGRILDLLIDPVIGHWSDQTQSRFGPRKPWMAWGVAGFGICFWLLAVPPQDISLAYLIAVGCGFFLCLTLLDVPYSAVGLELSDSVQERTRLASTKAAFQVAGALLAGSMPLFLGNNIPTALPWIAAIVCGLAAFGFVLFCYHIPVPKRQMVLRSASLAEGLKALIAHRTYRRLIGAFATVQLANAFFTALAVLYINHVLAAPGLVGALIAIMFVSTVAFLPLWQYLARRLGKLGAWRVAICTSCLAFALTPFAAQGDVILPAVIFAIIGSSFGGDAILPTSMLADITYEQEVSGNRRQAGLFLAVKNASSKLSFVAPLAIAFPALGWLNFEQSTGHTGPTLWLFLMFFAAVPILLKIGVLIVLHNETRFGALVTDDG